MKIHSKSDISSLTGSSKSEDSFWFCLYRFSVVRCSLLIKLTLGITWTTGSIRSIFLEFLKGLDADFTEYLNRRDSKISTNNTLIRQVKQSLWFWCWSIITWTGWKTSEVEKNLEKKKSTLYSRENFPILNVCQNYTALPVLFHFFSLASMSVPFINKCA